MAKAAHLLPVHLILMLVVRTVRFSNAGAVEDMSFLLVEPEYGGNFLKKWPCAKFEALCAKLEALCAKFVVDGALANAFRHRSKPRRDFRRQQAEERVSHRLS